MLIAAAERNEGGISAAIERLAARFGERLQTSRALCQQHGHTTTYIPLHAPDGVFFPETV